MKKILSFAMAIMMLVAMSSCTVSKHVANNNYKTPFKPNQTRLYLTMNDYEYLGQETIEVQYKVYLGIFRKLYTINGEKYIPRYYTVTSLNMAVPAGISSYMKKAMYKIFEKFSGADYIVPLYTQKQVEHMNGGRIVTQTMTFKAYRVKANGQPTVIPLAETIDE